MKNDNLIDFVGNIPLLDNEFDDCDTGSVLHELGVSNY